MGYTLPIKTKDALYALNPDLKALAEYTKINKVGGVRAFTLDTKEGIAESRNFCHSTVLMSKLQQVLQMGR